MPSPASASRPSVSPNSLGLVLAAGGSGTRFGADRPKTLLDCGGVPLWRRSLAVVAEAIPTGALSAIVVVAPAEHVDDFASGPVGGIAVATVAGGATRAQSVRNGLDRLAKSPQPPRWAVVHDAARPLVDSTETAATIAAAIKTGAALLTAPVVSTIKRVGEGRVLATVPRDDLRAAATPQVARLDWLLATDPDDGSTDESQALERAGRPVAVVEGSPTNIKVTTRGDLEMVEALLRLRALDDD